ncbi:MAG: hypothetical protein PWR10_2307 [Halanaerobiales bacterium]|nr:hypothetical protein [Halanaerobiales bacterium]
MKVEIRKYQVGDFEQVINLWNKCLVRDYISPARFQLKVLADSNFDPEGCLVAENREKIIGFMLGIIRKLPLEDIGLQEDLGWITVFFVDPEYRRQGIGQRLLEGVLDYFKENKRRSIYVSNYVPNYFFPGVDVDAYQAAFKFLQANGFKDKSRVIGMGNELQDMVVPERVNQKIKELEAGGIYIKEFAKKYTYSLLNFLRREFPGDWAGTIVDKIKAGNEDEIIIAVRDEEVLGYCQFEGPHFGPFGVSEKVRGKGIGSLLFWKVVEKMKENGHHFIWLAWTGGDAARFYREKGNLYQTREHSIMVKELKG